MLLIYITFIAKNKKMKKECRSNCGFLSRLRAVKWFFTITDTYFYISRQKKNHQQKLQCELHAETSSSSFFSVCSYLNSKMCSDTFNIFDVLLQLELVKKKNPTYTDLHMCIKYMHLVQFSKSHHESTEACIFCYKSAAQQKGGKVVMWPF